MAHKISKDKKPERREITVRTEDKVQPKGGFKWWKAKSKGDLTQQILSNAAFLKENQNYRYRQASINSRLYSNVPLVGIAGMQLGKPATGGPSQLPMDRPTMNVVQSCVDTLLSRVSQARPRPVFLTDNGDYKERKVAKQMNSFIAGEFYQTKAYELGKQVLRDAEVLGTGCLKVYEDGKKRVALDRILITELLVDPNDSLYGTPRQMYQLKLVDRDVLYEMFPEKASKIDSAQNAYPEASSESDKTISDQVMLVEAWHLPSGPDSEDGRHSIVCSEGELLDEEWESEEFPFVFLHYNPRLLGFWGQSLVEQLMGTQVEINKLLLTITRSINLVGVPRIFVEDGSKVVKAHFNNDVGSIITYRGTKPLYEVANCVPVEVYGQLQRLVDYAYQQSGISALAAASKKPEGLDSGVAIREYDDLQSDRFADLSKRWDEFYIRLAYQVIYKAKEIAERDGKYQTVYPNKNGTKEIDLPKASLLDDPFVIQCYDSSALPRDPAGRMQKVVEMIQSGMISVEEGRRLLDFPDLEQEEKLANAPEERILQVLDRIVDEGKYTPPDPFMNLQKAKDLSVRYYNLYIEAKLDEERAEMLRTFSTQVDTLLQAAMQPPPGAPQPMAPPQPIAPSPLVPQVPNGSSGMPQ